MAKMTGGPVLATCSPATGVTHVFMVPPYCADFAEMERRTRSSASTPTAKKSAGYMADGYARARAGEDLHGPGIGRSISAAGLRGRASRALAVIGFYGGRDPKRIRRVYQECDDVRLSAGDPQFNATVDDVARFPTWCARRSGWRSRGTGPVHLAVSRQRRGRSRRGSGHGALVEQEFARVPPFLHRGRSVRAALRIPPGAERPVIVAARGVRAIGTARSSSRSL